MTVYKSTSGRTALKLNDEITSVFCSCYRLEAELWHHVGNTEPFDPAIDAEVLQSMFVEMVENLDKQKFDLSRSMEELSDEELMGL